MQLAALPNPKDLEVRTVLIDRHGNTWFATFGKGVYFLPKKNDFIQLILDRSKVSVVFSKGLTPKLYQIGPIS